MCWAGVRFPKLAYITNKLGTSRWSANTAFIPPNKYSLKAKGEHKVFLFYYLSCLGINKPISLLINQITSGHCNDLVSIKLVHCLLKKTKEIVNFSPHTKEYWTLGKVTNPRTSVGACEAAPRYVEFYMASLYLNN